MVVGNLVAAERLAVELVNADSPLDDVLRRVNTLRAQADPDDLEQFDALIAAIVRLHRTRNEDRRQSRGLAALNDTAVDLAARRDVDELLEAICRRARALVGADTAYITLRDVDRGDTYVRATDGIVSKAFRDMRLPEGIGLGGLVAQSGVSAFTSDYGADHRFAHAAAIDAIVIAEGLRAIVGVPLRRGDETIGVLLAGLRSARHFDAGEIALFQALATHAAIAIENAQLFAATRRSYEQLERANAAIAAAGRLHARLAALLAEGAGHSEVVAALGDAVGGALVLADAAADTSQDGRIAVPVLAGAECLGVLLWQAPEAADVTAGRELLERGAAILGGQLLAVQARAEADQRRRGQLLMDILHCNTADAVELVRDAEHLGVSADGSHIVLVAEFGDEASRWAPVRASQDATADGGLATSTRGRLVVAVPGENPRAVAERWERRLGGRARLGVSRPAVGLAAWPEAYAEAVRALNLLRALDGPETTAQATDVDLFALLFRTGDDEELRAFRRRVLGPLVGHDQRRGDGALVATVASYLAHDGRLSATAQDLAVHVNTLYQRLERIDALLGAAWRSGDRQLELRVALRLDELAARMPTAVTPPRPSYLRRPS